MAIGGYNPEDDPAVAGKKQLALIGGQQANVPGNGQQTQPNPAAGYGSVSVGPPPMPGQVANRQQPANQVADRGFAQSSGSYVARPAPNQMRPPWMDTQVKPGVGVSGKPPEGAQALPAGGQYLQQALQARMRPAGVSGGLAGAIGPGGRRMGGAGGGGAGGLAGASVISPANPQGNYTGYSSGATQANSQGTEANQNMGKAAGYYAAAGGDLTQGEIDRAGRDFLTGNDSLAQAARQAPGAASENSEGGRATMPDPKRGSPMGDMLGYMTDLLGSDLGNVTDKMNKGDSADVKKAYGDVYGQLDKMDQAGQDFYSPDAQNRANQAEHDQLTNDVMMQQNAQQRAQDARASRGMDLGSGASTGIYNNAQMALASGNRQLAQDQFGRSMQRGQGYTDLLGKIAGARQGLDDKGFTSRKELMASLLDALPDDFSIIG